MKVARGEGEGLMSDSSGGGLKTLFLDTITLCLFIIYKK